MAGAPEGPRRVFYGRLRGKTLRPNQGRLLRDLLPRLAVPGVGRPGDEGRAPVEPAALFGDARPVWLEIGFGGGEHLAELAAAHPEVGLIGAEPFVNGVAMALARIEAAAVGNVRIHAGDARDLIDLLPAGSLARVYLLYPDPWPKTRHRERRFMNAENLAALARAMPPGAELRLATDIEDYVRHAVRAVAAAPGFYRLGRPGGVARGLAGLADDALRGEGAPRGTDTELPDLPAGLIAPAAVTGGRAAALFLRSRARLSCPRHAPHPRSARLPDRARPDRAAADPGAWTASTRTGRATSLRVVEERPLTIFLNGQEIVTAMTIGDYPAYLAVGYLRNQGMLRADDAITGVDYDEELETVVVRTARATDYEAKLQQEDPHLGLRGRHRVRRHDGGAGGADAAADAGADLRPLRAGAHDQHHAVALPRGGRDPRHRAVRGAAAAGLHGGRRAAQRGRQDRGLDGAGARGASRTRRSTPPGG